MSTPSSPVHNASSPRKRRFFLPWYGWLLLAGVLGYGVAIAMHWDDRGRLWLQERLESMPKREASIWLPDYRFDIDAKVLPGMEDDEASDLAYSPKSKTLFSVMGSNPFLVELTLDGDVLRKIPLVGWSNPEGVTVLENGRLAIVDERNHSLVIVTVSADTQTLNIADFPQYDLGSSANQNKAFEAVAWDPRAGHLLLGEERPPALFAWKSDGNGQLSGEKQSVPSETLDMRNLSALGIDPRTGHTLALSADSHMLLELDEKGEQVSFISLLGGFNGLKKTIPRAEGVAMDEQGTVYIVSEPDLFYRLRKP
ncbi:SdiA-regulated domain-containing protein [Pseudomonas sp. LS1212]|uniref:SdiA-regulated domain-containing protein n=1 Tax=Pseudomonas sp. LS1212 TaxID=2972478 RepID=UPI00215D53F0|nr:SdiA-regulated domain-containing protein [Pseudomonas sp. LS1212]UVJ43833.1 SdiA-regulated domain-containing protein [Pseudomonas sp. LS1212]